MIDYAALAKKNGGKINTPIAGGGATPDYASLAAKFGGKVATPPSPIKTYADQSANPAVSDTNPTPSWWSKQFAGTPFAPATEADVSYDNKTSLGRPVVTIGKMLLNVFSDAKGIVASIPQAIIHPIKTTEGLVSSVKGITDESVDAISTGIATGDWKPLDLLKGKMPGGDWSQLGQDVKKTEISVMNHPLSTVLLLDGALESSKNVLQGMTPEGPAVTDYRASLDPSDPMSKSPYGFSGSLGDMASGTVNSIKGYIDDINNARKNIAKAFTTKSTITEHLAIIQQTLSDKVASMKQVGNLKEQLTSFTDKPKSEVAGAEEKVNANVGQQEALKNQLAQEQAKLDELNQQHTEQTNKMADDQNKEMKLKSGFTSMSDVGTSLKELAQSVKAKLSAVYEKNLGNATVNLDGVFAGFDKLKSYLSSVSDTKTIKALQPLIDNLKTRELVSQFSGDEKGFFKQMAQDGIEPKYSTLAEYEKNFPAVTSENVKGTISNIEQTIRANNMDALKSFGDNVRSAFTGALKDSIKDTYGQDQLDTINANDKAYGDLKNSKLLNTPNPKLSDIVSGWKDFVASASKTPEGQALITKLQNYVGTQILDNAKIGDTYSAADIQKGLLKYDSVLDSTTKSRLNTVAESINDKTNIDAQQNKVEATQAQQKEVTQQGKQLVKEQAKINADARAVGNDSADVEKNIMKIDSTEKLQQFLQASGKTIKEVTPVIVHALLEQADAEAGKGSGANYDLKVIGDFIKKMNNLGGETSDHQAVSDAMLGGADSPTVKAYNELKAQYDKYSQLSDIKQKSTFGRVLKAAFGAFLAVGGLGFGRFKGISDLRSAFSSGVSDAVAGGRERLPIPEDSTAGTTIKKVGTAGAAAKIGQNKNNN